MIPGSQLIFFALGVIYIFFSFNLLLRKKVKAYYFFAALIFIVGYSTTTTFLTLPTVTKDLLFLYETKYPLQFLYGPAYYFFLLYLVKPNRPFQWKDLLHLLPAILHLLDMTSVYILSDEQKMDIILNSELERYTVLSRVQIYFLKIGLGLSYTIVGFIQFRIFFTQSGLYLFRQNKMIVNWMLIDFILRIFSFIFIYLSINNFEKFSSSYVAILLSIDSLMNVIFILFFPSALKGIRFKIAHSSIHYSSDHLREMNKTFIKNAELTDSEKELLLRLNDLMQLEHLFINEDLEINSVAKRLRCDSNELHIAISKAYGKNFDEYVNEIRIDFVQDRIQNEEGWKKLSLEKIAARSGFKTRIELENALKIKS